MSRADRWGLALLGVLPCTYITAHAVVAGQIVPAAVMFLVTVAGAGLLVRPSPGQSPNDGGTVR